MVVAKIVEELEKVWMLWSAGMQKELEAGSMRAGRSAVGGGGDGGVGKCDGREVRI